MSLGTEIYKKALADLRRECDEMVANGEISREDADFRFFMMQDDILDGMPDELFMVESGAGRSDCSRN